MKKALKIILIILGSIVGLVLILMLWGAILRYSSNKINKNVDISVTENYEGDNVKIFYRIENLSKRTQTLDTIDMDVDVFKYAELLEVSLKRNDEYSIYGMRSFEFLKPIQPGEVLEIQFDFKPRDEERDFIETDICINGPSRCVGRSFNI